MRYGREKRIEERWESLYPLMESGIMKFVSLKEYKKKLYENIDRESKNSQLTDQEILEEGMKIVEIYEKQKGEVGEDNGDF